MTMRILMHVSRCGMLAPFLRPLTYSLRVAERHFLKWSHSSTIMMTKRAWSGSIYSDVLPALFPEECGGAGLALLPPDAVFGGALPDLDVRCAREDGPVCARPGQLAAHDAGHGQEPTAAQRRGQGSARDGDGHHGRGLPRQDASWLFSPLRDLPVRDHSGQWGAARSGRGSNARETSTSRR